jgi:hypothetical protein
MKITLTSLSFSGFSLIQPEGLTRESRRYLGFPPSANWIPAFAGMIFLMWVSYFRSNNSLNVKAKN